MSQGLRMVHLRTVPDAWQAKVIAARLGSEGILTHLQGSVAGAYPFGVVSVLVEAEQADLAAALLMADEVESAFAGHRLAMAGPTPRAISTSAPTTSSVSRRTTSTTPAPPASRAPPGDAAP